MRAMYRVFLASVLVCGAMTVSSLALANDGGAKPNGQHRLLSAELRAKLERLQDKMREHRNNHHNHGGASASLESLQAEVVSLKNQLATLTTNGAALVSQLNAAQSQIALLTSQVSALQNGGSGGTINPTLTALAKYLTVDSNVINGVKGPHVIFSGVNVHVRSGSGSTGDHGAPTGLGNLIVGYNEGPHPDPSSSRIGSHNFVGGTLNAFTSSGGVVFGNQNWIQAGSSSILGGQSNLAQGLGSTILGGRANWTGSSDQTVPVVQ